LNFIASIGAPRFCQNYHRWEGMSTANSKTRFDCLLPEAAPL
jgi:hypothetical protein